MMGVAIDDGYGFSCGFMIGLLLLRDAVYDVSLRLIRSVLSSFFYLPLVGMEGLIMGYGSVLIFIGFRADGLMNLRV